MLVCADRYTYSAIATKLREMYHSPLIAPDGQAAAQAPQSMQRSGLIE